MTIGVMQLDHMKVGDAFVAGTAGAATVTLAHEVLRQLVKDPPRMDLLGMSALSRILHAFGVPSPRGEKLRGITLLADIVANAIYYAPIAASKRFTLARGALLGGAAGIGAVVLTPMLGLPKRHRGLDTRTQLLTIGLYVAGGIAAAAMASFIRKRDVRRTLMEMAP
jgi:hypothetical protein